MTTGRINQVTTLAADDDRLCRVDASYSVDNRANAERLTLARRSIETEATVAQTFAEQFSLLLTFGTIRPNRTCVRHTQLLQIL
jgi:hypothetical protein